MSKHKDKKVNLAKTEGGAFTEALNAASVDGLERALRSKGLSPRKRSRIEAALANRRKPKDQPPAAVAPAPARTADVGPRAKMPAKADRTAKARRPGGLTAAARVLGEAGKPMNCTDIVKTALEKGYWNTNGKTPAATIYAAIIREIASKGDAARFRKTDRGMFALAK